MFPTIYPSLKKFQAARTKPRSIPHSKTAVRDEKALFSRCALNTKDRGRIVAPRCVAAFEARISNVICSSSGANKHIIKIHRACGVAVCGVKTQVNARLSPHIEDRCGDLSPRRPCRNLG